MSDEEKKAIDILINEIADIVISEYCTHCKICENEDTECYYTKIIDIVYNLVQKQSKEIEELKEKIKGLEFEIEIKKYCKVDEVINDLTYYKNLAKEYQGNCIPKSKLKEILGIEEDINNEKLLSLLQTIVDENARLEDIEDRKVQIEYNNVFNKGVKSVEDKIKAKIEEVDIQLQKLKDGLTSRKTNFVNKNMLFAQKKVLQSLLEKE